MFKKLFLVLVLTVNVYSAEIVRYINVASEGGNGTTNAKTGENAAYKNKYDFNLAEATDLNTANNYMLVYCSGGTDTNNVTLNAWSLSSTDYLKFIGDGTYISKSTDSTGFSIIEEYVHFEGIKFEVNVTANNTGTGLYYAAGVGTATNNVDKCTFYGNSVTGTGNGYGLRVSDSSITVNVRNCLFYDLISANTPADSGFNGIYLNVSGTLNILNCTIWHCGRGMNCTDGTTNVKNTVIGNTPEDGGDIIGVGTINIDYCATDDANEGTNWVDLSPSATEADDWAAAFTDYANNDFSIKDTDSVLYNSGTNLSASGVTTDIIGTARPQATIYDIGAYEFVVAGAPAVKKPRIININMN